MQLHAHKCCCNERCQTLKDHGDRSLLSEHDETQELWAGQVLFFIHSSLVPRLHGKEGPKAASTAAHAVTQQGGHAAGACGTEDEGRASHQRDSTRKQPPRQNASLPRYTQLIPTSFLRELRSGSREGWEVPHVWKPSSVFTAACGKGDSTFGQAEDTYTSSFLTFI